MENILQINNIEKRYTVVKAVDNLSLEIGRGQVFGILGPNGSGKTTTLGIVLGIIKQNLGNFKWFDLPDNTTQNNRVGALLETPNFLPYLSAMENLTISFKIKGINLNKEEEINRVLKITNLYERRKSPFNTFSLGMKQRLAIANVLLGNPEVLVLDEPTNGLDPQGIAEIREIIIAEAKRGKTILLASHILDEVEKVCTHVAILKKGKLLTQGKVSELTQTFSGEILVVAAENNQALQELMVRSGMTNSVEKTDGGLKLTMKPNYGAADINKYAFQQNCVLSRLESQKRSLETQFLEILKQNK